MLAKGCVELQIHQETSEELISHNAVFWNGLSLFCFARNQGKQNRRNFVFYKIYFNVGTYISRTLLYLFIQVSLITICNWNEMASWAHRVWHYWERWLCWSRCGIVEGSVSLGGGVGFEFSEEQAMFSVVHCLLLLPVELSAISLEPCLPECLHTSCQEIMD